MGCVRSQFDSGHPDTDFMNYQNSVKIINNGGLIVLATDTLYGIHTTALNPQSVEKVYNLRKRDLQKPMIILIGSTKQLDLFNIKIERKTKNFLKSIWPDKVSVVLPCPEKKYGYLHRGKRSLAFRIPNKPELVKLLNKTGPLVSTSVNPESKEPAKTIKRAKTYFGKKIDLYLDEGKLDSLPSTLISINNGGIKVLRKGAVKITTTHI